MDDRNLINNNEKDPFEDLVADLLPLTKNNLDFISNIKTETNVNYNRKIVENNEKLIKNDQKLIKNNEKGIKNDQKLIKNDEKGIKNDQKLIKNDEKGIKLNEKLENLRRTIKNITFDEFNVELKSILKTFPQILQNEELSNNLCIPSFYSQRLFNLQTSLNQIKIQQNLIYKNIFDHLNNISIPSHSDSILSSVHNHNENNQNENNQNENNQIENNQNENNQNENQIENNQIENENEKIENEKNEKEKEKKGNENGNNRSISYKKLIAKKATSLISKNKLNAKESSELLKTISSMWRNEISIKRTWDFVKSLSTKIQIDNRHQQNTINEEKNKIEIQKTEKNKTEIEKIEKIEKNKIEKNIEIEKNKIEIEKEIKRKEKENEQIKLNEFDQMIETALINLKRKENLIKNDKNLDENDENLIKNDKNLDENDKNLIKNDENLDENEESSKYFETSAESEDYYDDESSDEKDDNRNIWLPPSNGNMYSIDDHNRIKDGHNIKKDDHNIKKDDDINPNNHNEDDPNQNDDEISRMSVDVEAFNRILKNSLDKSSINNYPEEQSQNNTKKSSNQNKPQEIQCKRCTYIYPSTTTNCAVCGASKDYIALSYWSCNECGYEKNEKSAISCDVCGRAKQS